MKTNILCMKITSCLAKTDVLRNLICIVAFLISVGTDKNNNISFKHILCTLNDLVNIFNYHVICLLKALFSKYSKFIF